MQSLVAVTLSHKVRSLVFARNSVVLLCVMRGRAQVMFEENHLDHRPIGFRRCHPPDPPGRFRGDGSRGDKVIYI
uniref:Uncharacterized protein n=1 Tax=Mastacembelus armatus TaxID=205130 RepID=A0A3Q3RXI3_9TELE